MLAFPGLRFLGWSRTRVSTRARYRLPRWGYDGSIQWALGFLALLTVPTLLPILQVPSLAAHSHPLTRVLTTSR